MSNKPTCNVNCRMPDLEESDICCYWCTKHKGCSNPCKNLDCKTEKEIEFEDGNLY